VRTLVIGSGGREHALALALSRDPNVSAVHVAPGNPGAAGVASLHDVDPLDGSAVASLAAELGVDLVVIGPEAPLVAGVADAVRARGIACFGPSAEAAQIEGSKEFAKSVMAAAEVPTGLARVCTSADQVADALDSYGPPYVVKDDRLAGGKGVVVTSDRNTALEHAAQCNQRGSRVLVEEFLAGPEVSLFAVTDGATVVPLLPAQDFKRVGDGDTGPNTGGMGAYCPLPWLDDGFADDVIARFVQPTLDELRRRGIDYRGVLYTGLMLTAEGPKLVEYNIRFGDPDSQVVLLRLTSDLAALLASAAAGRLAEPPTYADGAAVLVVAAAEGYPSAVRSGDVIEGLDEARAAEGATVFCAGVAMGEDGRLVTAGGRVLEVVGCGPDLPTARSRAYAALDHLRWPGAFHRTDIASEVST